jgi:hypothetical protein
MKNKVIIASSPLKNKFYTNETIINLQLINSNELILRVLEYKNQ